MPEQLVRVRALRDAFYAECRDCDRTWDKYGASLWPMGQRIAMHSHKQPDGTWKKSGGVKRAILYGYRAMEEVSRG